MKTKNNSIIKNEVKNFSSDSKTFIGIRRNYISFIDSSSDNSGFKTIFSNKEDNPIYTTLKSSKKNSELYKCLIDCCAYKFGLNGDKLVKLYSKKDVLTAAVVHSFEPSEKQFIERSNLLNAIKLAIKSRDNAKSNFDFAAKVYITLKSEESIKKYNAAKKRVDHCEKIVETIVKNHKHTYLIG